MKSSLKLSLTLVIAVSPSVAGQGRSDDPTLLRTSYALGKFYAFANRQMENSSSATLDGDRYLQDLIPRIRTFSRELQVEPLLPGFTSTGAPLTTGQTLAMLRPRAVDLAGELRARYGKRAGSAYTMGLGVGLAMTESRGPSSADVAGPGSTYARMADNFELPARLQPLMQRAFNRKISFDEAERAVREFEDSLFGHFNRLTPHSRMADLRRFNMWMFAASLSMAAVARGQQLGGEVVERYLGYAQVHARPLGITVPPLPGPQGSRAMAAAAAAEYILWMRDDLGPTILQAHGLEMHGLFRLGLNSMLPVLLWSSDDSPGIAGALVLPIERAGTDTRLPLNLWQPLVGAMRRPGTYDEVRAAAFKMRGDIEQFLEARAP